MEHLDRIVQKASEVRQATIAAYADSAVERYVTSFNSLIRDIPAIPVSAIWSNALSECSVLAESSYFLAVHGFYEEACVLLRLMLDGFLTRLYWHIRHKNGEVNDFMEDGKWTNEYAKWEMGLTRLYPSPRKDVWPTLLKERAIEEYNRLHQLKSDVEARLETLNKFVHGRPSSRYSGSTHRSSSLNIELNPEHFDEWFENQRAVFAFILILSLLEYPALSTTKTILEFVGLEAEAPSKILETLQFLSASGAA